MLTIVVIITPLLVIALCVGLIFFLSAKDENEPDDTSELPDK